MAEETKDTRREVLKKAAAFVIPTLVTFQTANLAVAASTGATVDPGSGKISVRARMEDY